MLPMPPVRFNNPTFLTGLSLESNQTHNSHDYINSPQHPASSTPVNFFPILPGGPDGTRRVKNGPLLTHFRRNELLGLSVAFRLSPARVGVSLPIAVSVTALAAGRSIVAHLGSPFESYAGGM